MRGSKIIVTLHQIIESDPPTCFLLNFGSQVLSDLGNETYDPSSKTEEIAGHIGKK